MKIMDDIKCNLDIGYSINPDFASAIKSIDARNFCSFGYVETSSPSSNITYTFIDGAACCNPSLGLKKGEIIMDQSWIDIAFPDGVTDLPFTVRYQRYEFPDKGGRLLYDKEFTVVGISNKRVAGFGAYSYINEEDALEYRSVDVIPYAVYLENYENADVLINEMTEKYFSWNSTNGTAVTLLNQSVSMFYELFSLFEILLVILIIVFLASYSIRNVKSNYYQIGVIKAIGGRSSDISKIYTAQTTLLTILVCILTYIGAFYLVDVANNVLIESFVNITNTSIGSINIIQFDPKIVLLTIAVAFVLSMLSTAAPLLALHRIKPINIIKAKE